MNGIVIMQSSNYYKVNDDTAVWQEITNKFKADLFVCLSIKSTNKGFVVEPDLMKTLVRINLPIGFDIYYE
jgi:hypothetical protein